MTMSHLSPQPGRTGLRWGLMLRAFWPALLMWGVATAALVALGYPAFLCVTPLAWVLALYTGWAVGRGAGAAPGWVEAGVAGGALGLTQGLLFGALTIVLDPGEAATALSALVRGAGIGLGGLAGCAVLSLLAAAWSRRAA